MQLRLSQATVTLLRSLPRIWSELLVWQGCLGLSGFVSCTRLQLVRFSSFLLCQIVLDQMSRHQVPRPLSGTTGSSAPQGSSSFPEAGQMHGASAIHCCEGQQGAEACRPVAAVIAEVPLGQPLQLLLGVAGTIAGICRLSILTGSGQCRAAASPSTW